MDVIQQESLQINDSFDIEINKKCFDCCYRLTIGTGKEIIKQLKELKDTVYVFKDEVYNFNFIQMRLKLCLKVSKFTKEMH